MTIDMRNLRDKRGEPHGLINVISNSVAEKDFSQFKEKDRESMKKLKAKEDKLVKVHYINARGHLNPNEHLSRAYCRWAGAPIYQYKLLHDQVYEVPQGFYDEVTNSPGLAQRSEILDSQGVPTKKDAAPFKEHRLFLIQG